MTASTDTALRIAERRVRRAESDLELARTPDRSGITSRDWIAQCEHVLQRRRGEHVRLVRERAAPAVAA